MFYVSDLVDNKVKVIDTDKNNEIIVDVKDLYNTFGVKEIAVLGLTFTDKRKTPRITVTSPALLMAERIPVGSACLLRLNKKEPIMTCLKVSNNKYGFTFFNGRGDYGLFMVHRNYLLKHNQDIDIDIFNIDDNLVKILKRKYKEFKKKQAIRGPISKLSMENY